MKCIKYQPSEYMPGIDKIRKKELIRAYSAIDLDTGDCLVDLRIYMGRAASTSTVYAIVWIRSKPVWGQALGSAGGYGYHKTSAAAAEAFGRAGMEFDQSFHGVGDASIIDAITAAEEHLGAAKVKVVEAFA